MSELDSDTVEKALDHGLNSSHRMVNDETLCKLYKLSFPFLVTKVKLETIS